MGIRRYLICLAVYLTSVILLSASEKHALLIGISDYPLVANRPDLEWSKIHGANDVTVMTPTLMQQGFRIISLTNSKATAANIRDAFKQLVEYTNEGDLVYIHLSGHGQTVEDANGDEEDGWDEAFIPYDACLKYAKGLYEGQNHILDDELEKYFNSIRRKAGPEGYLYVVIDACHSGGASRGEETDEEIFVRGTDNGFSPTGKKYIPRIDRRGSLTVNTTDTGMSGICILEACRAYQTNVEINQGGIYYGPLTYYINQYLMNKSLTPDKSWAEAVRSLMNKDCRLIRQNMVIESSR